MPVPPSRKGCTSIEATSFAIFDSELAVDQSGRSPSPTGETMIISASSILREKYGIKARPGMKAKCPFCKRNHLWIKRDDRLARCFNPNCCRCITAAQSETSNGLSQVLEEVFQDCHRELLSQAGKRGKTAYKCLVDEANIHPEVIRDSLLGAIPAGYDVGAKFQPYLQRLEAARIAEEEKAKRR